MSQIICFLSDSVMFWIIQAFLSLAVFFLLLLDKIQQKRAGGGGMTATVTRGEKSMAKYYALYASVNGLLVALALSVEAVENHKVIISVLDTICCFYIFVLNQFMRNKIVELTGTLTKVESR